MQEVVGSTPIFSTKNGPEVRFLIPRPHIILFVGIHKYSTLQPQGFYPFSGFDIYRYLFLIALPNFWSLMKAVV